jgi:hypothetical protein
MQNTEEYTSWLESRRLIISQLTVMDISIRELSERIDSYTEVSRERTLEVASQAESGITALKMRMAARELLGLLSSVGIGLISGGIAATVIELLALRIGR